MENINPTTNINMRTRSGFTYIELIITLILIAVCIIPVMRMFSVLVEQVYASDQITTAMYLAKEGMEKVKNLGFTKAQLITLGDVVEPPLSKPALSLNNNKWRVLRHINKGTDPLRIDILVFNAKDLRNPLIELSTLIEDLEWSEPELETEKK